MLGKTHLQQTQSKIRGQYAVTEVERKETTSGGTDENVGRLRRREGSSDNSGGPS